MAFLFLDCRREGWPWRIYQMPWKADKIKNLWILPDFMPLPRMSPKNGKCLSGIILINLPQSTPPLELFLGLVILRACCCRFILVRLARHFYSRTGRQPHGSGPVLPQHKTLQGLSNSILPSQHLTWCLAPCEVLNKKYLSR